MRRSVFKTAVVVQGLCVAVGLLNIRVLRRIWFPATLAASLWLGIWMIQASPEPLIDVVVVHKEAIDALMQRNGSQVDVAELGATVTF